MSPEGPGPGELRRDVVVVAASAGGLEAILRAFGDGRREIPAAVLLVLHLPATARTHLPSILGAKTGMRAVLADDGATLEPGTLYVAPPDCHLLVGRNGIRTVRGPRENGVRPAADPLFRSAARSFGRRVVAVVLSGMLDDGTAGLGEVRRRGGIAVVQEPGDALFDGMPRSALERVGADYVTTAAEIGPLLERLTREPLAEEELVTDRERDGDELDIVEMRDPVEVTFERGTVSALTCPECSGALWEATEGGVTRYRCRVGHAFSLDSFSAAQTQSVEAALWIAVRALEEHVELSRRSARRLARSGKSDLSARFEERARDAEQRKDTLRAVLYEILAPSQAAGDETA